MSNNTPTHITNISDLYFFLSFNKPEARFLQFRSLSSSLWKTSVFRTSSLQSILRLSMQVLTPSSSVLETGPFEVRQFPVGSILNFTQFSRIGTVQTIQSGFLSVYSHFNLIQRLLNQASFPCHTLQRVLKLCMCVCARARLVSARRYLFCHTTPLKQARILAALLPTLRHHNY